RGRYRGGEEPPATGLVRHGEMPARAEGLALLPPGIQRAAAGLPAAPTARLVLPRRRCAPDRRRDHEGQARCRAGTPDADPARRELHEPVKTCTVYHISPERESRQRHGDAAMVQT